MTVIPVWKKWPSFKNEIIYRFIIDFLYRFMALPHFQMTSAETSFRNEAVSSFRYDKWGGCFSEWGTFQDCLSFRNEGWWPSFRKGYRFITDFFTDLSHGHFGMITASSFWNEENGHHLKKSFRIIFDLLLDLSQAFRNDRELHFRYDRRNLHFGMIGASFRDVLSLLWLALLPHFGSRGDLSLIITERISFSLSLKRDIFRHKNWGHWKVKIIAWIFWKKDISENENHLKKTSEFLSFR